MKGIISHLLALAAGLVLGYFLFPKQALRPSLHKSAADVAPTVNTPQAPTAVLASTTKPVVTPKNKVASSAEKKVAAAVKKAEEITPSRFNASDFEQRLQALHASTLPDEGGIERQQAYRDAVAQVQQKMEIEIRDILCDSNRHCLVKLWVADSDDVIKAQMMISRQLRQQGLPTLSASTVFDKPPKSGEPVIALITYGDEVPGH